MAEVKTQPVEREEKFPVPAPKALKYVGPERNIIRGLPGMNDGVLAENLTDAQRKFVLDTIPQAAAWWA